MSKSLARSLSLLASVVALTACSDREPVEPATAGTSPLAESFWLATPPADAAGVIEARALAEDGDPVTVTGRVSGYVDSRAQFKLTDASFQPCNERPDDTCETPWDYCCEAPDELARATVVVEFHDDGALAKASLAGFHGFDYLKEVVVQGKTTTDEAGNVTVVATGLHVR